MSKEQEKEEEEYIEEEDEDFNPEDQDFDSDNCGLNILQCKERILTTSKPAQDNEDESRPTKKQKSGKDDDEYDVETEKEVKKANYSKIESAEGGLIKTRHQRAIEQQQGKEYKSISNVKSNLDVQDAWKKLQEQFKERLKQKYSSSSNKLSDNQPLVANERIKIKRKYEYAGEIVTEEKWVDRESAEAKEYLSTLTDKDKVETSSTSVDKPSGESKKKVNDRGEELRIVRKRPPLLEGIINGSIKPKFNTLEKSKLDFAQFVDKEGINDELVQHNKDGYLEKQDFLSRVQFHRESQIKEIRRKELQNKQK
jgi:hypothetical protein